MAELWPTFTAVAANGSGPQLSTIAAPGVVTLVRSLIYCGCDLWSRAYTSLEITAPPEPSYPLSFLAELDQPRGLDGAVIQLVEFAKQSPQAPWLIVHLTGYGGSNHELAAGTSLAQVAGQLAPSANAFDQLANVFASLRQSGTAPAGNMWDGTVGGSRGEQPTDTESTLAQTYRNDLRDGLTATATFTVGDYSPTFWTGSSDIVCATISGRVVVSPKPGVTMVQPASRVNFGATVPPGTYSSVTQLSDFEICLDRPTVELDDVVGLIGGQLSAAGVRAG